MSVIPLHRTGYQLQNNGAPISIFYTDEKELARIPREKLLSVISFANTDAYADTSIELVVPLDSLSEPLYEVWQSSEPVTQGCDGAIEYRHNEDIIIAKINCEEDKFESLDQCTEWAYKSILSFVTRHKFQHILRMWNYLNDINLETTKLERYKSFCIGRYNAFNTLTDFERHLPAASAIGSHIKNYTIYFAASRKPGIQVENPRQISAFHYPKKYSPKSPSFARATLKHWQGASHLFISGTASIVGHETRHEENVLIQLDETLQNIDSLAITVRDAHQMDINSTADMSLLKVYIRHPEHYDIIRTGLQQRLGESVPIVYLHGNICRSNLLLELEGISCLKHLT